MQVINHFTRSLVISFVMSVIMVIGAGTGAYLLLSEVLGLNDAIGLFGALVLGVFVLTIAAIHHTHAAMRPTTSMPSAKH